MNKQLFMKTARAILALVLFAGAVTLSSAQTMPSSADAMTMLQEKLQVLSPVNPVKAAGATVTATERVNMLRYGFYRGVLGKVKAGTSVDASIDAVYTVIAARDQVTANTLRLEVVNFLTKS